MLRWGGLKGIGDDFGHPLKQANERCPPPLVGLFDKLFTMHFSSEDLNFRLDTEERRTLGILSDEGGVFELGSAVDLFQLAYRSLKTAMARGDTEDATRAERVGLVVASYLDVQTAPDQLH